jgi:hypothetical protein
MHYFLLYDKLEVVIRQIIVREILRFLLEVEGLKAELPESKDR